VLPPYDTVTGPANHVVEPETNDASSESNAGIGAIGGVMSTFTVTDTFATPPPLAPEQVSVVPAVSAVISAGSQPVCEVIADVLSATFHETVTTPVYQPFDPSGPVIVGVIVGGVLSGTLYTTLSVLTATLPTASCAVTVTTFAPGCSAIALTVDGQVWGRRYRDVRSGFSLPPGITLANFASTGLERFPETPESGLAAYVTSLLDPSIDWNDVAELAASTTLPIVLKGILQDEETRATFVRLLQDTLPFVEDLKVERFADKSLLIALKEGFSDGMYLPAAFLSDGTLHLIALIVALYFDKSEVTIIEEPERNIHPHLISKVAAMLKDASRQKQVIVTTHNPELVKHADLEDLLLVQRDERGFSRITRPAEDEQLKVFLENDLGVDELYVQNLLGVGHGV